MRPHPPLRNSPIGPYYALILFTVRKTYIYKRIRVNEDKDKYIC
jgi:hypothetical protein